MRSSAVALAVVLQLTAGVEASAQDTADVRVQRARTLLAEFDRAAPGVAVAVVHEGRVLLSEGYGLADLEQGVPITSSTVFDLASLAKQFTGFAIATLAESGRIRLADDVRDHIPEVPHFGRRITIGHLVHHTSGLRDWPGTLAVAGWRYDDVISFEQILRMVYNQQDLNFDPGSEYSYSNTGYNLLAELTARVTGASFRGWMHEHLFRPLGMTRTHFSDDHTELVRNRASGYVRAQDGSFRRMPDNLTALGSSSLFSTADDLARWLINLDDAAVGGSAVAARMQTRGVLNDGSEIAYAFGLAHGQYRGLPTLAHSGSWAAFRTYLVHFPAQRFGVVVLANEAGTNPVRVATGLADIFLEGELRPAEAAADSRSAAAQVPTALLDSYVGVYRLGPGWYVRIRRAGERLTVQATREAEFPMEATSPTEFWVEAYDAPIAFAPDAEGRVSHLLYRGIRAPKMVESAAPAAHALASYAGEYTSEELATSYVVAVAGDSLSIRHFRHGSFTLTHAWGDEFAVDGSVIGAVTFQRDASGRVNGMLVDAGPRNRKLRFARPLP